MIVAVGSTNRTKIQPVKTVFSKHFPDVRVLGVKVSSGVRDQPMNEEEMYEGALNRARRSLSAVPDAAYGVGIEGGVHKHSYGWFEKSLVVIVNRELLVGIGATGGLVLPPTIIALLEKGKTLEEAVDSVFGTRKIGEGIGMFGLFTNGVVTRTKGVVHGVAFALAPFLHKELYA